MEVGGVRVKSAWHWVEENSVTCLCSQRTTYLLIRMRHWMGKGGASSIILGKVGLAKNLSRGHRPDRDGLWMSVWQQMFQGAGGRWEDHHDQHGVLRHSALGQCGQLPLV